VTAIDVKRQGKRKTPNGRKNPKVHEEKKPGFVSKGKEGEEDEGFVGVGRTRIKKRGGRSS